MIPSNFNWFLHVMLFYHTKYVLKKMDRKGNGRAPAADSDDDGDDFLT